MLTNLRGLWPRKAESSAPLSGLMEGQTNDPTTPVAVPAIFDVISNLYWGLSIKGMLVGFRMI